MGDTVKFIPSRDLFSSDSFGDTLEFRPAHRRSCFSTPRSFWVANTLLLLINILWTAYLLSRYGWRGRNAKLSVEYIPLMRIVHDQQDYWDLGLGEHSLYTQAPGPQVDVLWDEISAPPGKVGFIAVQKDELDRVNLTSVAMKDGSGYLATVDVFHQLHCLDFLRRAIYKDSYNMTMKTNPLLEEHISHCIDSIRLSLQCHADTSLLTFKWIKGYPKPWPDFRSYHHCRNWDDILGWAQSRMVDASVPGLFEHPILGPVDATAVNLPNPLRFAGGVEYIE